MCAVLEGLASHSKESLCRKVHSVNAVAQKLRRTDGHRSLPPWHTQCDGPSIDVVLGTCGASKTLHVDSDSQILNPCTPPSGRSPGDRVRSVSSLPQPTLSHSLGDKSASEKVREKKDTGMRFEGLSTSRSRAWSTSRPLCVCALYSIIVVARR